MTQRPIPAAALLAALPLPAWAQGLPTRALVEGVGPPLAWVPMALVLLVVALLLLALAIFIRRLQADGAALVRQPGMTPERLAAWRDMQAGLPDGTVRAAISIFIIAAGMLALMTSAWIGLPSTGEIGTIIGGVLGFYFGTRQSAGDGRGPGGTPVATSTGTPVVSPGGTPVVSPGGTPVATITGTPVVTSSGAVGSPGGGAPRGAAPFSVAEALDLARRGAEVAAPLVGPTPARVLATVEAIATGPCGRLLAGLPGAVAAPLAGLGGPAGLLAAVGLGAVAAAGQGQAAYARWKARVLDRPFSPRLFPAAALDGAVLLSVLEQAPLLARLLLDPVPGAVRLPRALAVAEAARLADDAALAALQALAPPGDAVGPDDWQAGLHAYRRLLLDALPGPDVSVDLAPVLGAGAPSVTGTHLAESLVAARAGAGLDAPVLDAAVLALLDVAESPGTDAAAMVAVLQRLVPPVEAVG